MHLKVAVLLIMGRERRSCLFGELETCGVEILTACDCAEGGRILDAHTSVQVVFTDTLLPDGDWRTTLETAAQSDASPEVVVCAPVGVPRRLWAEALEAGAYDVLMEPFGQGEVRRVVDAAAAKSYMRSLPPAREVGSRAAPEPT